MADSTHAVRVIRITEIVKHPNADTLGLVRIGGYQVVVKLDEFEVGQLVAYVQPDSILPERPEYAWLWADRGSNAGKPIPLRYRRVTARKFRKEWSEGLLLPLAGEVNTMKEGDDVAEVLGITHYTPEEAVEIQRRQQFQHWPHSLKGWFYFILYKLGFNGSLGGENEKGPKNPPPIYDVEALKNYMNTFSPGELVQVTEKIHGSNARFLFDGKMRAGSRKLWKSAKSKSIWREALAQNPWIEAWCRAHEGWTLYGEVTPTQKFKGGDVVNYGGVPGQVQVLAFDVRIAEGNWVTPSGAVGLAAFSVPSLYYGPYDFEKIKALVDGPSAVPGAKHLREGIVIRAVPDRRVHGLGRAMLKVVSNEFLVLTKTEETNVNA